MSFRNLTIEDREKLRRQEEHRQRAEARRLKDENAEKTERERLDKLREAFEQAKQQQQQQEEEGHEQVDSGEDMDGRLDADGVGDPVAKPLRRLQTHARTVSSGEGGLDALLEKEALQQRQQLVRMASGRAVNEAKKGSKLRGFDAELQERIAEKEDPLLALNLGKWVELVTSDPCFDLYTCLRNGITLCKLIEAISPGTLGPNGYNKRANVHLIQRDNIRLYLLSCEKFGMNSSELFEISDLHENRNIPAVVSNLVALSRRARFSGSYHGPYLEGEGVPSGALAPPGAGARSSQVERKSSWHRRSRSGTWGRGDGDDNGGGPPSTSAAKPPTVYKSSAPELNLLDPAAEPAKSKSPSSTSKTWAVPNQLPGNVSGSSKTESASQNGGSSTLVTRLAELQAQVEALEQENEELRRRNGRSHARSQGSKIPASPATTLRARMAVRLQPVSQALDKTYRTVGRVVVWTAFVGCISAAVYNLCAFRAQSQTVGADLDAVYSSCDPLYIVRGLHLLRSWFSN